MKLSNKLLLSILHHYTVLTGKVAEYGYHTLRSMQELLPFGTPSVDEFDHQRNISANAWHVLYEGVDAQGTRPDPQYDHLRSELVADDSIAKLEEHGQSIKTRDEIQQVYTDIALKTQQEATDHLWTEFTKGGLNLDSGSRPSKPWAQAGSVKPLPHVEGRAQILLKSFP